MDWLNILYKDCHIIYNHYLRYYNLNKKLKFIRVILLTYDKLTNYNESNGIYRRSIKKIIKKYLDMNLCPVQFYKTFKDRINLFVENNLLLSDDNTSEANNELQEIKKIFIIPCNNTSNNNTSNNNNDDNNNIIHEKIEVSFHTFSETSE
jgi:hypothetical protein